MARAQIKDERVRWRRFSRLTLPGRESGAANAGAGFRYFGKGCAPLADARASAGACRWRPSARHPRSPSPPAP